MKISSVSVGLSFSFALFAFSLVSAVHTASAGQMLDTKYLAEETAADANLVASTEDVNASPELTAALDAVRKLSPEERLAVHKVLQSIDSQLKAE